MADSANTSRYTSSKHRDTARTVLVFSGVDVSGSIGILALAVLLVGLPGTCGLISRNGHQMTTCALSSMISVERWILGDV